MKKEYLTGEIAHVGRNIRVKFLDENDKIVVKTIKADTEIKITKSERIDKKYGSYGYFIELSENKKVLTSTHSIPQFDFFTKKMWDTKIQQEKLIEQLLNKAENK